MDRIKTVAGRKGRRPILSEADILPIAKTGVSDILVQRILGFVTAGQLKAGDRLPSERDLAERFGVSRPTVREAMRALSVLGVVEVRHGGGAFVSSLDATDLLGPLNFFLSLTEVSVEKLYEARRLIEGEICALATTKITPEQIAKLEELIEAQDRLKADAAKYMELDSQFHRLLADISDNPFLARASASLNVLGIEFRREAAGIKAVPNRSIKDHKDIVDALKAGDADAARKAMSAHMDQVLASTRAGLEARS